ncbi:MAG: PQQ-binding-like beta-propeller repeat protein [Candidatus Ratteibacteria bacterium]
MKFELDLINIPFPPYQRNVTKLFEAPNGLTYGIIPSSLLCSGKIFYLDRDTRIHQIQRLPDDVLQVDSIIFNPDIAWTWDKTFRKIITIDKSGTLVVYDKNGPGKEILKIAGTRPYEVQGFQISQAFAQDAKGNLFTAGKDGTIFKINPETLQIEKLQTRLPSIKGREPWASLDAAATGDDGTIYLGTYDGYIAAFNPDTNVIINLGKPLRQQRIQALVFFNGIVFGIGGESDGLARWFVYDPSTRSFHLGGTLKNSENRLIYEPVNTMIVTKKGEIIGSFSGRLGSLFVIKTGKEK